MYPVNNEKGYTLVIALGVIVIVSIIGVGLMGLTSSGVTKNEKRQHVTQAGQYAEDGAEHLVKQIETDINNFLNSGQDIQDFKYDALLKYFCTKGSISVKDSGNGYESCILDISKISTTSNSSSATLDIRSIGTDNNETKNLFEEIQLNIQKNADGTIVFNSKLIERTDTSPLVPSSGVLQAVSDDIPSAVTQSKTSTANGQFPTVSDPSLLGLNVLNILKLNLGTTNNGVPITVGSNESYNLTIKLNIFSVVNLNLFSGTAKIYILQEITPGNNKVITSPDVNKLRCLLVALCSSETTFQYKLDQPGKYQVLVSTPEGGIQVSLASDSRLNVQYTKTTTQFITPKTTGNVLTNGTGDLRDSTTIVSHINTTSIPSGGTTINGTYGQLLIYPNGNFEYTPSNKENVIGQTERFSYTITNSSGKTSTAELAIHIQ